MTENQCDHVIGLCEIEIDGGFYIAHQSDCLSFPSIVYSYCPKCGQRLTTAPMQHELAATRQ